MSWSITSLSEFPPSVVRVARYDRLTVPWSMLVVILLAVWARRWDIATHTDTLTHTTILRLYGFCPGQPRWAGIRKVKPIWIYWNKRQWVAVASARPYANLHLTPDNHASIPPLCLVSLLFRNCKLNLDTLWSPKTTQHWWTLAKQFFFAGLNS